MDNVTLAPRAFALGFVCGMRSMLGPALVRPLLASAGRRGTPLRTAAVSPLAAALLPIAAAGEFVGDKLPNAPNRTDIPSVIFRSASGAGCGASLFYTKDQPVAAGAVLGLAGALIATYGIFFLRRAAGEKLRLPNLVLGLIEDGAALALGLTAVRDDS
jgi:uncharacterized membrane protein